MKYPDFTNAKCNGEDTEMFFPETTEERLAIKPHIIKMCVQCPVYTACRDYALNWRVDGIWAGMDLYDRRRIRHREGITPLSLGAETKRLFWSAERRKAAEYAKNKRDKKIREEKEMV